MRAHVEAFGCTLDFCEPRDTEDAPSGDLGPGSVFEVDVTDAAPTCLLGALGDSR